MWKWERLYLKATRVWTDLGPENENNRLMFNIDICKKLQKVDEAEGMTIGQLIGIAYKVYNSRN